MRQVCAVRAPSTHRIRRDPRATPEHNWRRLARTRTEGHSATEPHAATLMPFTLMLMQPTSHKAVARTRPSPRTHVRDSGKTNTPPKSRSRSLPSSSAPATPAGASKNAPSEHTQAGRQRIRSGWVQQQHTHSGWVRAPSVAPLSSTHLRRGGFCQTETGRQPGRCSTARPAAQSTSMPVSQTANSPPTAAQSLRTAHVERQIP